MIVPGVPQLAIIAVIVGLIFGTKRLRDLGADLGGMFKGIRSGFKEAASAAEELTPELRQLKKDVQTVTQAVQPAKVPLVDALKRPTEFYEDQDHYR